jgi:predicted permease
MARRAFAVRAYGASLRLLPPSIRHVDGQEMERAFEDLWRRERTAWGRTRLVARCFGRLPRSAAAEWLDLMDVGGSTKTGGWEMTGWGRQVRLAVRTLRKAPAFTTTTVLLIGLGVGAVTTIFTLVDHVLLRPLPYPAAERLITVEMGSHSGTTYREFEKLDGMEAWAGGYSESANLTGEGDPIRIEMSMVSENFFSLLGARPALGRLLVMDDFERVNVAVLSHALWERVFGAEPDMVGRSLRVDGVRYEVVGVLSADFEPPQHLVAASTGVYRPIDWSDERIEAIDYHMIEVAGRMAPGVSIEDMGTRLDDLSVAMAETYPEHHVDREGNPNPFPVAGLQDSSVQRVRSGLNLLLGAVGLLLLVACLNVAHLFLARGLGRVREMAIRRTMGAGPGGLMQQLMVESLVVGALGGALGISLAYVGLEAMLTLNPHALPRAEAVSLDLRVAAFSGAVALLTAFVFGLVPALRTIGNDLANELKGASRSATSGRGTRRLRGGLVVAEVAVSLVLVTQAGLLLKSYLNAQAPDPGFDPNGVWTIPLTPTGHATPDSYRQAMDGVLASLQSVPGVEMAAYGLTQPFEFAGSGRCCWMNSLGEEEGVDSERVRMLIHPVSLDYLETLRIPLVSGSVWSQADATNTPVPAVVSERFAIDAFGSVDGAMGRVFGRTNRPQYRVVGVAGDNKHYGLDQPAESQIYVPMEVLPFDIPMAHMAVRVRGESPEGLARSLREAVWRAEPDLPVPTIRPMDEWIDDSMAGRRFDSAIFGAFGFAALFLAAAGLYGTLLYNVRQQRRELGIRLALGAARERVERHVVGGGLRLAFGGAVLGVLASLWVGRLLEERLFEVGGSDPIALLGASALLLGSAALASWLPARRAGRTDPLETLKAE